MSSLGAISVWAIIEDDSAERMFGLVNVGRAIEITHVLVALRQLSDIARSVNESPIEYDQAAQIMARLIVDIERALTPAR